MSALLLAAAAAAQLSDGFVQFSRSPALRRERTDVAVGVLQRDAVSGTTTYWARRTTQTFDGKVETWTDSTRCAALVTALQAMRKLPPPEIAVPGMENRETTITLDGVGYRLTTRAVYAGSDVTFSLESNVHTPLADWVEASLRSMAGCWQDSVPVRTER